ncbi:hypothetical protein N9N26_01125 [Candidatus Poseidoniales archaeon]|nr:hypothetical protein [Candidatus Poseidoniales archaeon]
MWWLRPCTLSSSDDKGGFTMKKCQLCGAITSRRVFEAKVTSCFACVEKLLDFAITAGMRFEEGDSK